MDTRLPAKRRSPRQSRRRLGQHYLTAHAAVRRVVDAIAPESGDRFLEVGPGRGALTLPLLASGAHLLAVEIDARLADRLRKRAPDRDRLVVLEGDILGVDLPALLEQHLPPGRGVRAVGNLPYRIASPAILRLLSLTGRFSDLTVMVQREVADRILSPPSRRSYGILTLLCAGRAESVRLLDLSPFSFSPPPEVHSTLLRLTPRDRFPGSPALHAVFERVVKAAFSGRRKTIRNSLSAGLALPPQVVESLLRQAGLEPQRRPEEFPLEVYLDLAARFQGEFEPFLV